MIGNVESLREITKTLKRGKKEEKEGFQRRYTNFTRKEILWNFVAG